MKTTTIAAAAAAALIAGAQAASAVTISVTAGGTFDSSEFIAPFALETFEDIATGEGAVSTAVGKFGSLGGTGTGSTVVGTGTEVAVKNETTATNLGGRFNVTAGGEQFLDSNDTQGIGWSVDTGEMFNKIAFSLTDVADVGATMTISVAGTLATFDLSALANANLQLVEIRFSDKVAGAEISLENNKLDDGFGLDDAYVGVVPVPASALLLGTALLGLGAARRRANK